LKNNETYFRPMETIHESNPQEILDRHERINLVPMLIMAGSLDDNVLPEFQRDSPRATKRPAAISSSSSSRAPCTIGSPRRDR
jgi:hypothetical protein